MPIGIVCDLLKASHSIPTFHFCTRPFFLITRKQSTTNFDSALQNTTGYNSVLQTTPYYKVLDSTRQYDSVLPSTTQRNSVLNRTTQYNSVVLHGFSPLLHNVLPSTSLHYKVLHNTRPH